MIKRDEAVEIAKRATKFQPCGSTNSFFTGYTETADVLVLSCDYTYQQIKDEWAVPGLMVPVKALSAGTRSVLQVIYKLKCGTEASIVIPRDKQRRGYPTNLTLLGSFVDNKTMEEGRRVALCHWSFRAPGIKKVQKR